MRPFVLIASLFALTAALLLLVADSAGPCEQMEAARADYTFVLTCEGEEPVSGVVSFSNRDNTWNFTVEQPAEDGEAEGEEGGDEAEPAPGVSFVIARTTGDYSECSPAKGVGIFQTAMAEAEAPRGFSQLVFSCEVLPQKAREECAAGPVQWPDPDGKIPVWEGEQDSTCALVLTQAAAPEAQ